LANSNGFPSSTLLTFGRILNYRIVDWMGNRYAGARTVNEKICCDIFEQQQLHKIHENQLTTQIYTTKKIVIQTNSIYYIQYAPWLKTILEDKKKTSSILFTHSASSLACKTKKTYTEKAQRNLPNDKTKRKKCCGNQPTTQKKSGVLI
jgi:hypothetical protein